MFLGFKETIVGSLLCCGVGLVQCLFNLLCMYSSFGDYSRPQHQETTDNYKNAAVILGATELVTHVRCVLWQASGLMNVTLSRQKKKPTSGTLKSKDISFFE